MTIQTVSVAADAMMLLVAAGGAGLVAAAIGFLARGRLRAAGLAAGALAVVVAVYGAVLVGVGVASRPQQGAGDVECFDDWCAGLVSARRDVAAGRWLVDVQVQNRGRGRAMRTSGEGSPFHARAGWPLG